MPLVPAVGGGSLRVWGQPGLHSEFKDSQSYIERPYLEPPPAKMKKTNKQENLRLGVLEEILANRKHCSQGFKVDIGKAFAQWVLLTKNISTTVNIFNFYFKNNPIWHTNSISLSILSFYSPKTSPHPTCIHSSERVRPPIGNHQSLSHHWGRTKALSPVSRLGQVPLHR